MQTTTDNMKRLCCFFNYNPIYRLPIYKAMDTEMACDFYFGDSVFQPLKQFPPEELGGFQRKLHTIKTGFKSYKWNEGIGHLLRGYDDYLVTGQIDYLANWLLIGYAKLTGKHIYCWTHGIKKAESVKPKTRKIYRAFYSAMDGIFMYNKASFGLMEELGIGADKMHVIHNSMDTEVQSRLYRTAVETDVYARHFGNAKPTIVYIGRIQAYKKLDMLIEAVSLLNVAEHRVNLAIVGAPTDDFSLEDKIARCGQQEHVWLYGPCFDESINAELLYNACACVCPASVGLTAIHSLSYGTPVITNDSLDTQGPEFEAIKESETGSFYKANDVRSLAEAIAPWICKSPEERQHTRDAARKEIEEQWSVGYQMNVLRKVFPQYLRKQKGER